MQPWPGADKFPWNEEKNQKSPSAAERAILNFRLADYIVPESVPTSNFEEVQIPIAPLAQQDVPTLHEYAPDVDSTVQTGRVGAPVIFVPNEKTDQKANPTNKKAQSGPREKQPRSKKVKTSKQRGRLMSTQVEMEVRARLSAVNVGRVGKLPFC